MAEVIAMVEHSIAPFGRMDAAFSNAGPQVPMNIDRAMAINLFAIWICMRHKLRRMQAQGERAIVLGGLVGIADLGTYPNTT